MHPATHFLISWVVANGAPKLERRERALITIGGIIPDFDGFGAPVQWWTQGSERPLMWYAEYHHILGHNIAFCAAFAAFAAALARPGRRLATGLLTLLTLHLHLLCDVLGSKGPDGAQWPIPYLLPFSDSVQWTWSGQWQLNAWPNLVVTAVAILITGALAWRRGFSPLEMVSRRADAAVVEVLHRRLPKPAGGAQGEGSD